MKLSLRWIFSGIFVTRLETRQLYSPAYPFLSFPKLTQSVSKRWLRNYEDFRDTVVTKVDTLLLGILAGSCDGDDRNQTTWEQPVSGFLQL